MLRISGVSKAFGSTRANDNISLELRPGEIVGLLGENGAGKSTLLSIVAGYLRPDAGEIWLEGQQLAFGSPRKAIGLGIGLVHQHLSVIPEFTVGEQLDLAGYTRDEMPAIIRSFSRDRRIEHLSLGERQRLEIARSMVSGPKVLLLDEPTSILSPDEVEELFAILRELRDIGMAVVLVTHKLREVLSVADRIVVMNHGRINSEFTRAADDSWGPGTESDILGRMFDGTGVQPVDRLGDRPVAPNVERRPVLCLTDVSSDAVRGRRGIGKTSAQFDGGVLYTLAGIDGQGQRELVRMIAGYDAHCGRVSILGTEVSSCSAMERADLGISMLVDDRLGEGAIGEFTLAENLALKRSQRKTIASHGIMHWSSVRRQTAELARDWDVRPGNPEAVFSTLSGGNMQRFLAGKEFRDDPVCLIAMNPVQGLDARTASFLWNRFRDACDAGGMVLAFTTDLDEAIEHGDMVGVMRDGQLSAFEERSDAGRSELAAMMVNGW